MNRLFPWALFGLLGLSAVHAAVTAILDAAAAAAVEIIIAAIILIVLILLRWLTGMLRHDLLD